MAIGVAIAMGYSLQTWGLQSISSSKSALSPPCMCRWCPLLQWLCLGRLPGVMSCIGIVRVHRPDFAGRPENNLLALGPGEIITLVGAIAIAAEIILISAGPGRVDVKRVTVVQLATASLVAFATMVRQESVPPMSAGLVVVALGLGIFSAAIIQVMTMNWAQRSVIADAGDGDLHQGAGLGGDFWTHCGERLPLLALVARRLSLLGCW